MVFSFFSLYTLSGTLFEFSFCWSFAGPFDIVYPKYKNKWIFPKKVKKNPSSFISEKRSTTNQSNLLENKNIIFEIYCFSPEPSP